VANWAIFRPQGRKITPSFYQWPLQARSKMRICGSANVRILNMQNADVAADEKLHFTHTRKPKFFFLIVTGTLA